MIFSRFNTSLFGEGGGGLYNYHASFKFQVSKIFKCILDTSFSNNSNQYTWYILDIGIKKMLKENEFNEYCVYKKKI